MESTGAIKQVKIKTGTLNRSVKDYNSYVKEIAQNEAKLAKLKETSDDEGKIR